MLENVVLTCMLCCQSNYICWINLKNATSCNVVTTSNCNNLAFDFIFEAVLWNIPLCDTSMLLQVQCIFNWPWTRVTGWTLLLVRTLSSTSGTTVPHSMDILFKGTEENESMSTFDSKYILILCFFCKFKTMIVANNVQNKQFFNEIL